MMTLSLRLRIRFDNSIPVPIMSRYTYHCFRCGSLRESQPWRKASGCLLSPKGNLRRRPEIAYPSLQASEGCFFGHWQNVLGKQDINHVKPRLCSRLLSASVRALTASGGACAAPASLASAAPGGTAAVLGGMGGEVIGDNRYTTHSREWWILMDDNG